MKKVGIAVSALTCGQIKLSNACRKSAFVILPVLLALSSISSVFAETATATANANTATATTSTTPGKNLTDHTVEDMVAISKIGQQNEAVNEAVLGNEAIRETLNNDALPFPNAAASPTASATATQTSPSRPTTSNQAPVAADKLILNNPVVDEAKVLSASEKQALEQKLRGIYQRGLAQAAVVIVPSTDGEDIFDYAMKVAERWQLGRDKTDNGLLMVVAVNDRKLYILTGYGLEGTIPDAVTKRIINDDISPYFKQGDYAGGITAGFNRMEERLMTDPTVLKQADAEQQTANQTEGMPPLVLAIFGFFAGTILTRILGRFLGSLFAAGGVAFGGMVLGTGIFASLLVAAILFFLLLVFGGRGGGGRGGRGGGGFIVLPGGGGFGGGGFGGGGFGGGGGGFGGGGAGGSW